MLYEMISGNRPFEGKNKSELMQSVISSNVTFPEFFSEEAKDLINNLLQKNQSKRLSVEKLKEHKFYKGIDWTKVLESKSIHMPFVPIQERYTILFCNVFKLIQVKHNLLICFH